MLNRRDLLTTSLAAGTLATLGSRSSFGQMATTKGDRIRGLLLGSMIGDALGGPIEFQKPELIAGRVLDCRSWPDERKVQNSDLVDFANSLELLSYRHFRPKPEPYGQWQSSAAPGTVTDDTRHKLVLINALRNASVADEKQLTQERLAQAYLELPHDPAISSRPDYKEVCAESFREFWKAARWVLGERDLQLAAPPDRIWGGTPTCCGQMTILPLAAIYSGRPELAYRKTYELSFFDVGAAKDINAAIVAGLSVALTLLVPTDSQSRKSVWKKITDAMRSTDPYHYQQVPFVQRPIIRWLNFAQEAVKQSNRQPKRLYQFLEDKGKAQYFWESHFILALVFSAIEFCNYDPLAAMALILDFGHDTDSGAQLLGAFAGAIHGVPLFPAKLQEPVLTRINEDYDINLDDWIDVLQTHNLE